MDITELRTEAPEWDAFVHLSEAGSPFHLTAWKRAVEATFAHRAHYLMAKRGGGIEGVLPLFEVRGPLGGRALISVPYAVYGGVCATTEAARTALLDAAAELGQTRRARYIELRHRRDYGAELPTKSLYVTFSRSISKDDDENARAIPRKQRRMTRRGASLGLRSEIGRTHLDAFYDIYARNLRSLGSPVFPRALLEHLLEEFDQECQLLTVWLGERMVAGVMTLFYEDQVLPFYGAAVRDNLLPGVNDFMYWELMRHAAQGGYRVFDFGRSREGTGSYDFKRNWGFAPVPLPYQYVLLRRQTIPNVSPSNPRLAWAINAWRRLPLGITNSIGPFLTRYLP